MSSTSPVIFDDAIKVIKAARLANASALASLAAAFDTSLQGHTDWFWKAPLERSRHPNHFLTRAELSNYVNPEADDAPFWAPILSESVALIANHFKDIPFVWAAFAVEEISAQPQGNRAPNLGLEQSIVLHTNAQGPGELFKFKYSVSKPFLDARLAELKNKPERPPSAPVEQRGIGLCVTKEKLSALRGQLHFIHVNTMGTMFLTDMGRGDENVMMLNALSAAILKAKPRTHLWDGYVHYYKPLGSKDIHCHLSATSLFHSLTNAHAHAAAHLVFGFGSAPKSEQALLIYHAMQIALSGLPALYSSMMRLRQEASKLAKYKQMIQLLEPRLKGISGALGQMQRDSQELRAVLYEPEEALFASYSLVEPYFRNATKIHFEKAGLSPIASKHTPSQYDELEIRLVTALICCAVFGEHQSLFEQEHYELILSKAASVMTNSSSQPSSKRMAEDLAWLVKQANVASLFAIRPTDMASAKEDCATALNYIKAALFTPFKPDSSEWPKAALQLLHRHQDIVESELIIFGETLKSESPPSSNSLTKEPHSKFPCSYSTVLTFIRDFIVAAKVCEQTQILRLQFDNARAADGFKITLSKNPGVTVEHLRNDCSKILRFRRDWRVENANYGDMTRAFVLFASRLMGIGEEWKFEEQFLRNEIIHVTRGSTTFVVSWSVTKLQLNIQSKR